MVAAYSDVEDLSHISLLLDSGNLWQIPFWEVYKEVKTNIVNSNKTTSILSVNYTIIILCLTIFCAFWMHGNIFSNHFLKNMHVHFVEIVL
jgi:hypothetical protein